MRGQPKKVKNNRTDTFVLLEAVLCTASFFARLQKFVIFRYAIEAQGEKSPLAR